MFINLLSNIKQQHGGGDFFCLMAITK